MLVLRTGSVSLFMIHLGGGGWRIISTSLDRLRICQLEHYGLLLCEERTACRLSVVSWSGCSQIYILIDTERGSAYSNNPLSDKEHFVWLLEWYKDKEPVDNRHILCCNGLSDSISVKSNSVMSLKTCKVFQNQLSGVDKIYLSFLSELEGSLNCEAPEWTFWAFYLK